MGAANNRVIPADCDHKLAAILGIGEKLNGLLKSLWRLHETKLAIK
jgi:hypothetical protein